RLRSRVRASSSARELPATCGLHGGLAERRGNGLQIRVHGFKSRTHLELKDSPAPPRAIGAAVARFLDTEEVTGSNPVSPTSTKPSLTCRNDGRLLAKFGPSGQ